MTIEQHLPHRLLPIVRQVAYTCRIPIEGAALGLSSSLAGISSGREGAWDCNGTPIAAKFNVILAGPTGPFRRRLRHALTGSIEGQAKLLSGYKELLDADKVAYISTNIRRRATERLVERERLEPFAEPFAHFSREMARLKVAQKPAIFLRSPGRPELLAALRESAEQLLLVDFLEEDFLGRILDGWERRQADREFLSMLVRLIDGEPVAVGRGRRKAGHEIIHGRLSVLFGATPESLRRALRSQSQTVAQIFSRSAFIDLACGDTETGPAPTDPEIQLAGAAWQRLVREALWRRRSLIGRSALLNEPLKRPNAFGAFDELLEERLKSIPAERHDLLADAVSWPVRLFGIFVTAENSANPDDWARLRRGAEELAVWLLEHQCGVIAEAWEPSSDYLDEEESRMYQKLCDRGPMVFRDLLRTYATQKNEVHRPVLERLLERGKVRLNNSGLLEAVRAGEENSDVDVA